MQETAPVQLKKGMAIASLVLGIISIPTCGLLVVGSIAGIVLGILALNNANKKPDQYGGKGLAIGGVVTSLAGLLLIAVNAAIAIPQLNSMLKRGRETAAIATLKTIHQAEASFFATNKRYGTLKELAASESIPNTVVDGKTVGGYRYSEAEVSANSYCLQATRVEASIGRRDFNITEKGEVYAVETNQPANVPCGQGIPLE